MKKDDIVILGLWLLFEMIAVGLWLTQDNLFYLVNFSYIGTCLAIGLFLYQRHDRYARHMVQFSVGLYMLVYLGILSRENMQLEGFWYYLFLGVFEAAVIHYLVAKIAGPLLFGRGWCGYACWTAMVLDLLPYKTRAETAQTDHLAALCMVCGILCVCGVAVSAADRTDGNGDVLEFSDWQWMLLCSRHLAGFLVQG